MNIYTYYNANLFVDPRARDPFIVNIIYKHLLTLPITTFMMPLFQLLYYNFFESVYHSLYERSRSLILCLVGIRPIELTLNERVTLSSIT